MSDEGFDGLNVLIAVARFDFSWGDPEYHQETLNNLKAAVKSTKKLCAVWRFKGFDLGISFT